MNVINPTLDEEEEYYILYGTPSPREFWREFEDPAYDSEGVCLDSLFDDIPY